MRRTVREIAGPQLALLDRWLLKNEDDPTATPKLDPSEVAAVLFEIAEQRLRWGKVPGPETRLAHAKRAYEQHGDLEPLEQILSDSCCR